MALNILVAEDSATMRKILEMTFAGEDVQLRVLADGEQLLEQARKTVPDLVLADSTLEGLDGYDIARTMRAEPALQGVPVLVLASQHKPFDPARAAAAGVRDHVLKPFDTQALIDKVRAAAGKAAGAEATATDVAPPPAARKPPPAPPVAFDKAAGNAATNGTTPSRAPFGGAPATYAQATGASPTSSGGPAVDERAGPRPVLQLADNPETAPSRATTLQNITPVDVTPVQVGSKQPPGQAGARSGAGQQSPSHPAPVQPTSMQAGAPAVPYGSARGQQPMASMSTPSIPTPGAQAPRTTPAEPAATNAGQASAVDAALRSKLNGLGLSPGQLEGVLALSREVIEQVVWEVVPDLAEAIIKEEIQRLTS